MKYQGRRIFFDDTTLKHLRRWSGRVRIETSDSSGGDLIVIQLPIFEGMGQRIVDEWLTTQEDTANG